MKKTIKWVLIVVGSLLVLFIAAAAIIPVVFKDDIKKAIDEQIAKNVNADVAFDDFNLSLFRNFPNITAEISKVGVLNRAPFEGEALFVAQELTVEINLMDVVFGDQVRVKGITLREPVINVIVLEDGRANYDIAVPSADTVQTTEEPSQFSFGIDHWEVINGDITYDDRSLQFLMALKGMNHSGSGDFTQDVFDLKTNTTVDSLSTAYGGVEYISDKKVNLDAVISISEEYTKYTFKDNKVLVNDFAASADGWFKMNENDFGMDIAFKSPENTFKSLLSLVPGMYSKDFDQIKADGELAFSGFVKGTYSETQMPAFNLNLLVKDGMFQYPDLPTAVKNINMDLLVDNKDGVIDHTIVDLKKLHLDFGSNPVDARALVTSIYPTNIDANVKAKLNLTELTRMFPLEGLEMRGAYALDLTAKGVYDSLKKTIPAIDATMALSDGYVKSKDVPVPLEDLRFNSTVKNSTGNMAETVIRVSNFAMLLEGERFNADLLLQNLNDYTWDLKAKGGIDLGKITKIFPIEGMTLAGKVVADLQTKGKYSDVQAERYDKLPTSGSASLTNFQYVTKDLPEVSMSTASMVFDPKKIELKNVAGKIGKSDFAVDGIVTNYMGYVFGENEVIKGKMNFNSSLLDLNEFMTDTEETATADTASFSVIPVPERVDFVLSSNIKQVKLMDFNISNAVGDIVVKDGVANLSGIKFNMLGGSFGVTGSYNTKNIQKPTYDFGLKIENVSMKEAANASSIVQTYAPVAGLVNGNFSTDFKISGLLKQDMMPDLSTVNGSGLIKVAQAALSNSKLVSGITSLTKLENTDQVTLKDVLMSASISNGKLSVKPFDVKFGSYKTTVSGSTGLDGKIDYNLKMDVPAGKLGTEFNSFVSKYSGTKTDPNAPVPVTIALGGTYASPTPRLLLDGQKEQAKDAVTNAVKTEGTNALKDAVKGTEAEKIVGGLLGGSTKDSTASDTTKKPTDVKKQIQDGAKKKISDLLKKKGGG